MTKARPNAVVGGTLVAVVFAAAIVGSLYTPFDPIAVNFQDQLRAPDLQHLLGTDEWGRDVLSRLLSGAVVSVTIAGSRPPA